MVSHISPNSLSGGFGVACAELALGPGVSAAQEIPTHQINTIHGGAISCPPRVPEAGRISEEDKLVGQGIESINDKHLCSLASMSEPKNISKLRTKR